MAETRPVIDVGDRMSPPRAFVLGFQHLMCMFSGTVLVPLLTGLSPSIAIMCSGIGTMIYLLCTKSQIPSYLGSAFAFITPIAAVAGTQGVSAVGGALVVSGLVFLAVAGIVKLAGTGWIDRFLPAPVTAPVVIVIGVGLSANAIQQAFYNGAWGTGAPFSMESFAIAAITLAVSIAFSTFAKGHLSTMPVLIGIIAGYVCAACIGMVDFQPVLDAAWVGLPSLVAPTFSLNAILLIAPVTLVVVIEHIGHLLVVEEVVGRDYSKMLPRSLAGDGLSTLVSGLIGGTPTTTYAQNIGVISVTRVYSTQVFWYAAAIALVVGGFCPKLEALINSIPTCVIGGVSILLFGLIALNGLEMMVNKGVDFKVPRNQMIISSILILGIGMETAGISIPIGSYALPGMAASALLGIILNIVLPREGKPDKSDKPQKDSAEEEGASQEAANAA